MYNTRKEEETIAIACTGSSPTNIFAHIKEAVASDIFIQHYLSKQNVYQYNIMEIFVD